MNNNKPPNGNGLAELERRLWSAADQLCADSPLRPFEYPTPVLGLIFSPICRNLLHRPGARLKTEYNRPGKINRH